MLITRIRPFQEEALWTLPSRRPGNRSAPARPRLRVPPRGWRGGQTRGPETKSWELGSRNLGQSRELGT